MLPEIQELTENINAIVGGQRRMSQAVLSAEVKQLRDRIEKAVLLYREREKRLSELAKKITEIGSAISNKG